MQGRSCALGSFWSEGLQGKALWGHLSRGPGQGAWAGWRGGPSVGWARDSAWRGMSRPLVIAYVEH